MGKANNSEDNKKGEQPKAEDTMTGVTLYGSGNKEGSSVAIVQEFQGILSNFSTLEDDPNKKIPKWQKNDILELKDKQIGSLKSQFHYLKGQKKSDFIGLYADEIGELKKTREKLVDDMEEKVQTKKDEIKENFSKVLSKMISSAKEELVLDIEGFETKGSFVNDIKQEDFNIDEYAKNKVDYLMRNTSLLDVRYELPYIPFDDVINKHFYLHYETKFREIYDKITTLEKQFEEALNWNLLITAMKTYQELKKADVFMDAISKMSIIKVPINFESFSNKEVYNKLVQDYEQSKVIALDPERR